MRGKSIKLSELRHFFSLLETGITLEESCEKIGRSSKCILQYLRRNGMINRLNAFPSCGYKAKTTEKQTELFPTKSAASLHDFTPREMMRYLYDLGYRIEDGKVYFIQKQEVNINSVINE